MKYKGTPEEWRAYAEEINYISYRLLNAIVNPDFQKLLPKDKRRRLQKALNHIDKFRSEAEDEMERRDRVRPDNDLKIYNGRVWFGRRDVEEKVKSDLE